MATWRSGTVNSLSASAGSTITATRTITAGDLVVLGLTWEDSQTLSSVSDTAGGTWAIATQSPRAGSPQPIGGIAYCLSHPGGSTTITATLSGTANPLLSMDVLCFTPAASTSFAFDVAMTPATGASATSFPGNAMTTLPGVVVEYLAGYQLTTGVAAGGSPAFTRDTTTENASGRSFAQYLINASGGTVTPAASWGAPAAQYVFLAASFKEVAAGPTIDTQPVQQVAASGATATFTVSATASGGSLSYQWRKNGATIGGATTASYTTPTLGSSDNLSWYDVDVTDSNGTVRSARAYLVIAPAAISGKGLAFNRTSSWWTIASHGRSGSHSQLPRKFLAPYTEGQTASGDAWSDWAFNTSANNVTVGLTGSLVTVSAGTVTAVGGDVPRGWVPRPGPGVGPFNDNQFVTGPRSRSVAAVSPDVTVALTGSAVTVSAGTLTPATTITLNGQAVTASAGTLTPSLSVALTGSEATVSAGTLTPATALTLSGAVVTGAAGTVTPATATPLLGEVVTVSAGTITATSGGDVTVTLTGSAVTVSAGSLGVSIDVSLSGAATTAAAGTVSPEASIALTGQAVTVSAGTLTAQVTGDVTVALTGATVDVQTGSLVAVGGDVQDAASGGFLNAYDAWRAAQERRKARQRATEKAAQDAAQTPVDAEIGTLLRARIAEQDQAAELARLKALVAEHEATARAELDSERVRTAFDRAATAESVAALEALARELARMREEEEFALLMILAAA